MKVNRIDHVCINVRNLEEAKKFFLDFGLELMGETHLEGAWLDTIVGLKNVKTALAMLRTPKGETNIELVQFFNPLDENNFPPPQANMLGIRHIAFVVEDIESHVSRLKEMGMEIFSEVQHYEDSYKLCYVRGPEGIILELAEPVS